MSISEKSQAQDPHNLPDNFHRQFMYYSSVGICALIFIVTVLRQFIFSFPFYLLAPSYVISFIFSVVAWRERVKGSFSWHAKLYFLGIFLLIINGGISNGGLRAPIVAGIVLLPIIAGALFDLKKSWLGFVSSALCLSIILFLEKQGWVTSYKDKDTMPIFMMTLSVSALATVIGHTYNKVRHENRRSLYKLHEELTHLAKVSAIADMANALAHEINNPLAIISGRAQSLLQQEVRLASDSATDRELSLQNQKKLESIISASNRIASIIVLLNDLSQSSGAKSVVPINLKNLVEKSLLLFQDRFAKNSVVIKINVAEDINVSADENSLSQVFVNLLENSLDHILAAHERWIEISASVNHDFLKIEFTDSGLGIEVPVAKRMFDPFFSTKNKQNSVGLGLSLAKKIIEAHQGTLSYEAKSKNTKFVIQLPSINRNRTKKSA